MFAIYIISCLVLTITSLPIDEISSKRVNPELLGGGFEGDMIFPPNFNPSRGVGINGVVSRWPNRVIPYDISAITNTDDRTKITNAINQLVYDIGTPIPGYEGRQACVYFRAPEANDREILKIQYGSGCSASIGYGTGYQKKVTLQQSGCFYNGIIQHELVHVLGFFHEQSRPDRDSYITIHHENINPNEAHNFDKYQWGRDVESQGFSYDYGSLMHYQRDSFTKNGKPTITPRDTNAIIGQREKLSTTDILEIRHYYGC